MDLTISIFSAPLYQVRTKPEAKPLLVPWWLTARSGPRNLIVRWMQPSSTPEHHPWGLAPVHYVWRCGVSLRMESLRPCQPGSQRTAPDELILVKAKAYLLRCCLSRGKELLEETGWKSMLLKHSYLAAVSWHKRRAGNQCGKLTLPLLKHLKGKLFCGVSPVAAVLVT